MKKVNMFTKKYNISLLQSNWEPIIRNLKMSSIPRKDEYIWYIDKYYLVLNVIHTLNANDEIILMVDEQAIKTIKTIL